MSEDRILAYLCCLSNGALNYYQSGTKVMIMEGTIRDYIEQLQQKNEDLQQKIDKSIEYIKKTWIFSRIK